MSSLPCRLPPFCSIRCERGAIYGVKDRHRRTGERLTLNGHSVSFHTINLSGHVGNLSVVVHMCRDILNVDACAKGVQQVQTALSALDTLEFFHFRLT